jgi:hypothetical protein
MPAQASRVILHAFAIPNLGLSLGFRLLARSTMLRLLMILAMSMLLIAPFECRLGASVPR